MVVALCASSLSHVRRSHSNLAYDFWTEQHYLEEQLQHVRTYALEHLKPLNYLSDPNVLSLNLILQATIICLYSVSSSKLETMEMAASASRARQSREKCMEAIAEITTVAKLLNQINHSKVAEPRARTQVGPDVQPG